MIHSNQKITYGVNVYDNRWVYRGQIALKDPLGSTNFHWCGSWYVNLHEFIGDVNKAFSCAESVGIIHNIVVDNKPSVSITKHPDGKTKVTIEINID